MSGKTQFEGRTAEEAVARARKALGDSDALRCWKTRKGGVGGFFAREVYVASLTPPPGSERSGAGERIADSRHALTTDGPQRPPPSPTAAPDRSEAGAAPQAPAARGRGSGGPPLGADRSHERSALPPVVGDPGRCLRPGVSRSRSRRTTSTPTHEGPDSVGVPSEDDAMEVEPARRSRCDGGRTSEGMHGLQRAGSAAARRKDRGRRHRSAGRMSFRPAPGEGGREAEAQSPRQRGLRRRLPRPPRPPRAPEPSRAQRRLRAFDPQARIAQLGTRPVPAAGTTSLVGSARRCAGDPACLWSRCRPGKGAVVAVVGGRRRSGPDPGPGDERRSRSVSVTSWQLGAKHRDHDRG